MAWIAPGTCRHAVSLALCAAFALPGNAHAEFVASVYGGKAVTPDTDLTLTQPGNTRLTFEEVSWEDESFHSPIYYGLRLGYWIKEAPQWGLALDFTHAKMYAELQRSVTVSGTRNGVPVRTRERVGETFNELNFSHGYNLLTLNALYRWPQLGASGLAGRLQPYAGFGGGIAVPHAEISLAGIAIEEYQSAGPAYQALAGLSLQAYDRLSLFAEYKLNYAELDVNLSGGNTLEAEPWTHHFIFGASYHFR